MNNQLPKSNGVYRWIAGILAALATAGLSYVASDNRARIQELSTEIRRVSAIQSQRGERITAVETQLLGIHPRLDKIEAKLDDVLARLRR
jgi:hypothetical protein